MKSHLTPTTHTYCCSLEMSWEGNYSTENFQRTLVRWGWRRGKKKSKLNKPSRQSPGRLEREKSLWIKWKTFLWAMRSMWNFPLFLCAKFLQLTLCRNCTHSEARIGIWNSGREFLTLQFLSHFFFSEGKNVNVDIIRSQSSRCWSFQREWAALRFSMGRKSFRIFHIVFQRTATTSERERDVLWSFRRQSRNHDKFHFLIYLSFSSSFVAVIIIGNESNDGLSTLLRCNSSSSSGSMCSEF